MGPDSLGRAFLKRRSSKEPQYALFVLFVSEKSEGSLSTHINAPESKSALINLWSREMLMLFDMTNNTTTVPVDKDYKTNLTHERECEQPEA